MAIAARIIARDGEKSKCPRNDQAALVGTYRAVREKHVPRYLAEFEYQFNRRYDLETMIPRLAFVALRTAPMPYRLLKLADVAA